MSTSPPPDPSPSSQALAAWGTAALVVATVLVGALAPARHAVPPPRPAVEEATPTRAPAEDAACLEWTDGCTVCKRLTEGPACSLPGIACQPGAPRCLHRGG